MASRKVYGYCEMFRCPNKAHYGQYEYSNGRRYVKVCIKHEKIIGDINEERVK